MVVVLSDCYQALIKYQMTDANDFWKTAAHRWMIVETWFKFMIEIQAQTIPKFPPDFQKIILNNTDKKRAKQMVFLN